MSCDRAGRWTSSHAPVCVALCAVLIFLIATCA
jgi:hypothetical protein